MSNSYFFDRSPFSNRSSNHRRRRVSFDDKDALVPEVDHVGTYSPDNNDTDTSCEKIMKIARRVTGT